MHVISRVLQVLRQLHHAYETDGGLAVSAQAHSEKSKQDLTAYEQFKTPQMVTVTTLTPNRKEIGKAFKKDAKVLPPSPDVLQ